MEELDSRSRRLRLSPAMAVAMLALLVSLGGSAAAAVHALITSRDIKDGTIRLVDISSGAKANLHGHADNADLAAEAYALVDPSAAPDRPIEASLTPTPGRLLPLDGHGRLPAAVLPTVAARVYSSKDEPTRIQIAGGPVQRLTFDSVSFDTGHMFDPRRPTDLTAPIAGVYLITTNVSWAIQSNATVGINRAVYVYVNDRVIAVDQRPPAGETRQTVSTLYKLDAGDTVEVGIGQDAGDLTANAVGDYAPSLAMALIGPT
ncbi:MAG TPA: hypothetical protein VLK36_03020 [Gaiellaceae bacterium]|nr:hypothetical protein [Gaiellaceae bacterium]